MGEKIRHNQQRKPRKHNQREIWRDKHEDYVDRRVKNNMLQKMQKEDYEEYLHEYED